MDLHLTSARATAEERAAVDELLGPEPADAIEGRFSRAGHAVREQRTLLLPALHALQGRIGWISEGGLNYVCERLTRPARGGLRGRHVLRDVQRGAAAGHGGACLRRPCVPGERVRGSWSNDCARTPASDAWSWVAEPVPRHVRAGRPRSWLNASIDRSGPGGGDRGLRRRGGRPDPEVDVRGRRDRSPAWRRRGVGEAPSPAAGGRGRPHVDRRLPGPWRLRGAPSRDRARLPRPRSKRGLGREAARSRRCGVPDRRSSGRRSPSSRCTRTT